MFGAGAAACVAAANIFRAVFESALATAKPDSEVTFSTLHMATVPPARAENPRVARLDIGDVYLAGVGAIGNGFLWALSETRCVGTLHLIDGEELASSNLQRYVMTIETDATKKKVDLGKTWMSSSGLSIQPHPQHWEEFVSTSANRRFEQVVVAVDTASARINIQASLPRRILNGWTQGGEAGVSRHSLFGKETCLACLYMPEKEAANYDQLVARALHFAETQEQLLDIRRRLRLSVPTDRGFLEKVANAANVPLAELLPFENRRLDELYSDGICGGAIMALRGGGAQNQRVEVPMAFQSALAGVLLAADLVAQRLALRASLPTKTQVNVLTALAPFPSNGQARASRCFCNDPDFIAAYQKKYGDHTERRRPPSRTIQAPTAR